MLDRLLSSCVRRGSAGIVAARYLLATGDLSPKEALRLVRTVSRRLSRESDPATLRRDYGDLTSKLRPLATRLDGAIIQRPDEARKLQNLTTRLRALETLTDPDKLAAIPDDELDIAVPMRLERLEELVAYVARVADRLTDYAKIERVIPHGKYELRNNHGFRSDEYAEPLAALDAASEAVTRAGFGRAIYGTVILESRGAGYAGLYSEKLDVIRLDVSAQKRIGDVYTLVHEIGHRVWHKLSSQAERDAYEDAYYGTAPQVISIAQREAWWEALVAADFDVRRARVPSDERATFVAYVKDVRSTGSLPKSRLEFEKGAQRGLTPEIYRRIFVRPKRRHYTFEGAGPTSVTDYGQTKVEEDFAEVFAHFCTGRPLTPDAAARFTAATGKR